MVSCGQFPCVSYQGERGARSDLLAGLLQQFLVMFVDGNDVAFMLDLDGISRVVAPSCKDDRTVQCGLDHGAGRCCDVNVGVYGCIVTL